MTNIRRYWQPNRLWFLTHVTFNRAPVLVENVDLIHRALETHRLRTPYDLIAWSVLPDHMHLIIDSKANDTSLLMRRIKLSFSSGLRRRRGLGLGRVWQYRFWDHMLRDEADLSRHIDYIHFNAVKHGYVADPFQWAHSSLGVFLRNGMYNRDWMIAEEGEDDCEYGE